MWVKYVGNSFKRKAKIVWIRLTTTYFKISLIAAKEHTHSFAYTHIFYLVTQSFAGLSRKVLAYSKGEIKTKQE